MVDDVYIYEAVPAGCRDARNPHGTSQSLQNPHECNEQQHCEGVRTFSDIPPCLFGYWLRIQLLSLIMQSNFLVYLNKSAHS